VRNSDDFADMKYLQRDDMSGEEFRFADMKMQRDDMSGENHFFES
jgi:hypothetical protein